jgi:hypothetical protein
MQLLKGNGTLVTRSSVKHFFDILDGLKVRLLTGLETKTEQYMDSDKPPLGILAS